MTIITKMIINIRDPETQRIRGTWAKEGTARPGDTFKAGPNREIVVLEDDYLQLRNAQGQPIRRRAADLRNPTDALFFSERKKGKIRLRPGQHVVAPISDDKQYVLTGTD